MKKYLSRILSWTLSLSVVIWGLGAWSGLKLQADPVDQRFSIALAHAPSIGIYVPMSEAKVAAVIADRLRGVPKRRSSQLAPQLAGHLIRLCREHRFDPALILSLIHVESTFRTHVTSSAGAIGLMQIMPPTARQVARRLGIPYSGPEALKDPFTNLSIGVAYLKELRDKYLGHSPYFHIAAYNIGPGRLDTLLSRKSFKPTKTWKYYEAILNGIANLRGYPLRGYPAPNEYQSGIGEEKDEKRVKPRV